MSRKSFVLYTEWENTFNRLSNELAGELIKVIFDYVRTGEIPQIDNAVVGWRLFSFSTVYRP